jgi:hypothetical protein
LHIKFVTILFSPIPVAARFKAWIYGHSLAGIAVSNSAGGHEYLSVLYVVRYGSLRQADHSSRGFPTECGVSEYDREVSTVRRPWPTGMCLATRKKSVQFLLSRYNLHLKPNIWEILKRHTQTDLGYCGRQGVEKCFQREFSCFIYRLCISATDVTNSNVPLHCMKVLGARGGTAPLIFNLRIRQDHKLLSTTD